MKTITAKEFQLSHGAIIKEVANGEEYEVTFHRKPIARLVPVNKNYKSIPPGSHQAFMKSLDHAVKSEGDLHDLSYKELRKK